jgi:hypothetical protein
MFPTAGVLLDVISALFDAELYNKIKQRSAHQLSTSNLVRLSGMFELSVPEDFVFGGCKHACCRFTNTQ